MPIISIDHEESNIAIPGSNFGYSAATIDHLEATGTTEYTLATIVVDASGSVHSFRDSMEKAVKSAFESWKRHPRADYLLVRLISFNDSVHEVHGFRLLADCDLDSYTGFLHPSGTTALYAAVVNGVEAMRDYAEKLTDRYFTVNAITVVVTDGLDNRSAGMHVSAKDVEKTLSAAALSQEVIESHVGILVGVNVNEPEVKAGLAHFEVESGFTQYVELEDADPDTLARLGQFMARSVSSQSQSLGTGGPSQPLSF